MIFVARGVYNENLVISEPIKLYSQFAEDGNPEHIDETVIDGTNEAGGSVLYLNYSSQLESRSEQAEIMGFTIQNGQGTEIIENINGDVITKIVGGGFYAESCLPRFKHNVFNSNGCNPVDPTQNVADEAGSGADGRFSGGKICRGCQAGKPSQGED